MINVLVTDESAFTRTVLTRMIESDSSLRVTGWAAKGPEALEKIRALQPDVVTLDVGMPGLDGLETLKHIMKTAPRPVIMVSLLTQQGAEITLEALACGAFDCVPKRLSHSLLDVTRMQRELVAKIRAAAESPILRSADRRASFLNAWTKSVALRDSLFTPAVVAIGTSTGGPQALQEILPLLPADLPVPLLIVQHMPPGFTEPLARRLNGLCKVSVREAVQDDPLTPGVVYIAPAGRHLTVYCCQPQQFAVRISNLPEDTLHTPSVDVMMSSVAETFGASSMGVILTGMGCDGLEGMQAIARAGGLTLGQAESSCMVYGMPKACAESGLLHRMVELKQIPGEILQATRYRRRA